MVKELKLNTSLRPCVLSDENMKSFCVTYGCNIALSAQSLRDLIVHIALNKPGVFIFSIELYEVRYFSRRGISYDFCNRSHYLE